MSRPTSAPIRRADSNAEVYARCSPLELRRLRLQQARVNRWAVDAQVDAATFALESLHEKQKRKAAIASRKNELDQQREDNDRRKTLEVFNEQQEDRSRLMSHLRQATDWFSAQDATKEQSRQVEAAAFQSVAFQRLQAAKAERQYHSDWAQRVATEVSKADHERLQLLKKEHERKLSLRREAAQERYNYLLRKQLENEERVNGRDFDHSSSIASLWSNVRKDVIVDRPKSGSMSVSRRSDATTSGGGTLAGVLARHKKLCRGITRIPSPHPLGTAGTIITLGDTACDTIYAQRQRVQASLAESLRLQIEKKRERQTKEREEERRECQRLVEQELAAAAERDKREARRIRESRQQIVQGLQQQLYEKANQMYQSIEE